jgi:hypothetical protein
MPALEKGDLHQAVLDALDNEVDSHGAVDAVPFLIKPKRVVQLAIWAFTVTSPPGGRHPLESKIQIMVPGQARGERGSFQSQDDDTFPVLLGYKPEEGIFVLWDAYKHADFAFSKNVQVRAEPLLHAMTFGIGRTTRRLATGDETIIVARADRLHQALTERVLT